MEPASSLQELKFLVDLRYSGSLLNRWRVRHTKKAASHCLVLILSKPRDLVT